MYCLDLLVSVLEGDGRLAQEVERVAVDFLQVLSDLQASDAATRRQRAQTLNPSTSRVSPP